MKDFNVQTAPNKTNICDSFYVDNQVCSSVNINYGIKK